MSSILPVFIPHLGCPHTCVFCNQRRIASPEVPSRETVFKEITDGISKSPCPELAFYGGSFTAIPGELQEEYLSVAHAFLQDGRLSGIRVSTRPDAIDEERLLRLKKYGVETVEIGAQSFDDEVLAASSRGHTREDIINAAKMIKAAGFKLVIQIMAGLPESDMRKDIYSAEETAALRPYGARIYPVCVIRDTELYDMTVSGEYLPITPEEGALRASYMIEILEKAGIKIIRVGLNPTEELSGGGVFAGAYHPALGQMAYSQIYLRLARELLKDVSGKAILTCPAGRLSDLRGQKNINVRTLKEEYPDLTLLFEERAEQKERVKIERF